MSDDKQMAVIGRMVTERVQLRQREAVLAEKAKRISEGVERVGHKIACLQSPFNTPTELSQAESELLDAARIARLFSDMTETRARIKDLDEKLKRAGV